MFLFLFHFFSSFFSRLSLAHLMPPSAEFVRMYGLMHQRMVDRVEEGVWERFPFFSFVLPLLRSPSGYALG